MNWERARQPAQRLFRAHVPKRSHDVTRYGQLSRPDACQAKISQISLLIRINDLG